MDACTWCVHDPAVHSNGVGCVKANGLETAWERIGSAEDIDSNFNREKSSISQNIDIKILNLHFARFL